MTAASPGADLRAGEQLLRIHHFRFFTSHGCALGSVDIVVEEALGPDASATGRCMARPHHVRLVTRPDYAVRAGSVDAAVAGLVERLRGHALSDAFLPTP